MQLSSEKKAATSEEEKEVISKLTESSNVPILIKNFIFKNNFYVEQVRAQNIDFENVEFQGMFCINGSDNEKMKLQFLNCKFSSISYLSDIKIDYIQFLECTVSRLFAESSKYKNFILTDSNIKFGKLENVQFECLKATDNRDTKIALINSSVGKLTLSGNDKNFEFRAVSEQTDTYTKIRILDITPEVSPNGIYSFYKVDFDHVYLTGISNSYIEFLYCNLNKINIHQFINNSNMKVSGLTFTDNSILTIIGSDFGKLRMFGIDFTAIAKFKINIININEVVSSGVTWCKSIPGDDVAASKRDVFKQLKNIATKQKDKFQELEYYNLEMDQHKAYLTQQKGLWNDKFILCFNKYTNNHGLSWMRPLGLIGVNVFLFYFIIKVLLGFDEVDMKYASSTLSEILECFSPVRKFSDSFGLKNQTTGSTNYYVAKILDIIFLRVFLGLLIFQMVKAFRKYVNT